MEDDLFLPAKLETDQTHSMYAIGCTCLYSYDDLLSFLGKQGFDIHPGDFAVHSQLPTIWIHRLPLFIVDC
ncbi:hypothetical protein SDC9_84150 [bioreactor metagenome]|uniref:Uncharacterized protein n=1 Tax=bioreactor metagenome TaxID=1076179 RepID=A0A644Z9M6_9ZZZZ